METLSLLLLILLALPTSYLLLLIVASIRQQPIALKKEARHRFAILIPAHNEESVIGTTVKTLQQLAYPAAMFDIHVVADHCHDKTAMNAHKAGAIVHERNSGPRGTKGDALKWLSERVLPAAAMSQGYDAAVLFDADTQADTDILRVMDAYLTQGAKVVQGQQRISNPHDGWFPALTWAMYLVDNRYQNLGRSNLGWSAKHMGDTICFRTDILHHMGWGEGLTEDYALRQQLLLEGIKIQYAPQAVGNGEAALNWKIAAAQRARWLRGTHDASRDHKQALLRESLRKKDLALLDGALQAYLPSYSTLTLLILFFWLLHAALWISGLRISRVLVGSWTVLLGLMVFYPFPGLLFERAPFKAFAVILSGPAYIIWRSWVAFVARFRQHEVQWIRTPRRSE